MKKNLFLTAVGLFVLITVGAAVFGTAQDKPRIAAQNYECASIKWDGADRVHVYLPDRAETMRVFELAGTTTPKQMPEEEFCLTWMANKLAKEGWEPVNLDSRRILFRRALK